MTPLKLRILDPLIVLLVLTLGLQACQKKLDPQESCNFVQNSEKQRVSWKAEVPVNLMIHASVPAAAYAAIDRAVAEYNATLGRGREVLRITARGVGGDLNPRKDGSSLIYWFTTWDPAQPKEQARTTIYWAGAQIFEADIRINASKFSYYVGDAPAFSEIDLTSLLVHEFGHALGLAHNNSTGSVMNVALDPGQERRKLGGIDLESLRCEY